jgi:hypothetical protein
MLAQFDGHARAPALAPVIVKSGTTMPTSGPAGALD